MPAIEFGCLPTAIGSVPQTDPATACRQVAHYLKDIPVWPQLPRRSYLENMYVQFSQGFPGIVVNETEKRIYVDRSQDLDGALEALYAAYLEDDVYKYAIGAEYAAGLHTFLSPGGLSPLAVKGQVTGPFSWGLTITDESRRSIIYDDVLADAAARLLRLKASWQERVLGQIARTTIIFIDEPYMDSFGSAFVPVSREKAIALFEEVLGGINGIKGIHCCGNTDWSVLLETTADIISYDTYNYAESLSLYPEAVKGLLGKGGAIAWGIVPNEPELLAKETVASLKDRLEEAMAPFTCNGVSFRQLVRQSLLTPSCSLEPLITDEATARALELLAGLSAEMRKRYL